MMSKFLKTNDESINKMNLNIGDRLEERMDNDVTIKNFDNPPHSSRKKQ
jgi:hypothetical protein